MSTALVRTRHPENEMKKTLLLLCGATACSAQSLAERDNHVPTLTKAFCADVSQYLAVDGTPSPQQQSNFTLCLDAENLRWNRAMDDGSSIDIFNGTDLWHLVADTSLPRARQDLTPSVSDQVGLTLPRPPLGRPFCCPFLAVVGCCLFK